MIKRKSKIFSFLIAGIFTVGLCPKAIIVSAVEKSVGINTINPLPQSLEAIGDGFSIGSKVTLIGAENASTEAVIELKELLDEFNIQYEESNKPSTSNTNIYIGEVEDGELLTNKLSNMGIDSAETLKDEGYVLASKNSSTDDIVLQGKDDRGTYYAVQTLEQLLIKVGEDIAEIPEVEIRDYPSMKLRGSIEGFYGAPWSHKNRLDQLEFYGENKMNTYIYAPKDDPYHREKWDEPYPVEEMDRMQELIDKANEKNVDFVFGISPGNSINLHSEEDYKLLEAKLQQMYDMGVRSFAVFFDDISNKDAMGQSKVLNRVQREFIEVKGDCKPLIMVPQEYTLGWTGSYTTTMAKELDEDILVMWTGNDVVPATITKYDIERAKAKYNRNELFIWWNFPVNDYCQDKLLMGPTEGLDLNLDDLVAGIASNPMNESEASKPTLYTVGDYSWNTKNYNRDKSWDNAIKDVGGAAYEGLKTFTEHSKSSVINGQTESTELKPLVDDLLIKWQLGEDVTELLQSVKEEFAHIEDSERDIRENINNPGMIENIDEYLTKLAMYGQMGQDVVEMIEAQIKGDMNNVWSKKLDISNSLKVADEMRVIKAGTPRKVTIGSKVVDPFIREAIKVSDKLFEESITGEKENMKQAMTSMSTYESYLASNMVDGNLNTHYWSARAIEKGDYIGIDLVVPQKVNSIMLQMDKSGQDYITNGQLEYSLDGENWTSIGEARNERGFTVEGIDIEARYIRYRALEDEDKWLKVYEFDINLDKSLNDQIYSNINGCDSLEVVNKDGYYGIQGNDVILNMVKGDYIGLQLSKFMRFDKIDVAFDKEVNGVIQYSSDGREWETLEEINGVSASKEIPYGAKYIRVLLEESATGVKLMNFKATIETQRTMKASTNMPTYSNNGISRLVDGNEDTYFWSSRGVAKGDYVQVDLGKLTNVRDITLIMAHNSHPSDYIEKGQMEYSVDGNEWIAIGSTNSETTVIKRALDIDARYLRYIAVEPNNNWATFCEFKINTEEVVPSAIVGEPEGAKGFDISQMIDKNLLTAYKPMSKPTNGQEIIYKPGNDKPLTAIHIFQDPDSISNAYIQVNDKYNNWVSVGRLDEAYNVLVIDPALEATEIKVVWDENGELPIIYEIMPQYTPISDGGEVSLDFNKDGKIDIVDLAIISKYYGQSKPEYDLNGDNIIDELDIAKIVEKVLGQ